MLKTGCCNRKFKCLLRVIVVVQTINKSTGEGISTTNPINDPTDLENVFLKTSDGRFVPLSTIAIQPVGGVPSYAMFGSLDTHSSLANLMFEIETLAENVIHASDAYAPYLRAVTEPQG